MNWIWKLSQRAIILRIQKEKWQSRKKNLSWQILWFSLFEYKSIFCGVDLFLLAPKYQENEAMDGTI
jgi:hypothetical protein